MDNNSILAIVTALLILTSAYFSATETAFSSLNSIRLKSLVKEGNKRASLALSLWERYDNLLSTILIGNNIVNILGASLATILFTNIYGGRGVTYSTITITILVLIFGEISPKSLAKEKPEQFAMVSAPFIRWMMFAFTPFNFIFGRWQELLSKFFKVENDQRITEDELLTFVHEAQSQGVINDQEGELIRSAIEFNDLDVRDVLTPRVDVIAIDISYTNEQIEQLFSESNYSRLPVYQSNIDHIIGVLHEKDFNAYLRNQEELIENIINPVVFVAPTMKISMLLRLLQKTKSHLAVITDEYGGTMGIVTLEDILEELVGEIWDEHDEVIEDFVKLGGNEYKISAGANIDKMLEYFNIDEEYNANTVGGFVMQELEKIPKEGDHFSYKNLFITITKIDSGRVLEIHVKVLEGEE